MQPASGALKSVFSESFENKDRTFLRTSIFIYRLFRSAAAAGRQRRYFSFLKFSVNGIRKGKFSLTHHGGHIILENFSAYSVGFPLYLLFRPSRIHLREINVPDLPLCFSRLVLVFAPYCRRMMGTVNEYFRSVKRQCNTDKRFPMCTEKIKQTV